MQAPSNATVESMLPLKPVVFHILLALAREDAHGYGVIQAVRTQSDGLVKLETGSFYRHLRKLLEEELVEESEDRPVDVDPRRGAYYRLTPTGRQVLQAEGRRLARLVSATSALGLLGNEGSG